MNLFGTDGIRNKVGSYPLTQEALPLIGKALALWAEEKYGSDTRFLIAQDTRYSGPWIKAGIMSGLLRYPIIVYDAGVLPTPGVFNLMQEESHFTGGIIISASHNKAEDNGIKIVDRQSGKLSSYDEKRICELMGTDTERDFSVLGKEIPFPQAKTLYRKNLSRLFSPTFLEGKTIVLDCANGASCTIAPQLFRELGATVIAIHQDPDGFNINKNCGATSLASLQQAVLSHEASIGFAFDGDADRVIAVNKKGEIKDGDDLLAFLMSHKDYKDERAAVSTVMANYGLTVHLTSQQKKLLRTAVGDKHVLETLDTENLLLGGEPSGHIILKNLIRTGDGMLVALKVLETMVQTNNELLESFTKFPQIVINVPISHKKDLNEPPFASFIATQKELLTTGRLLVRYSGTEPLLRVLVEGRDLELVKEVAQNVATHLQSLLS
jgi:phosphoglucosamine mutase